MAIKNKISIKEFDNGILIQDCTGKYYSDNTGGWGAPNIKLSNVDKCIFEIYKPSSTTPVTINAFPDYPTDDTELKYEVLCAAIGETFVESGVWRVGMRISGTTDSGMPFEKYCETKEVFTSRAECCVDKLVARTANIPPNALTKDALAKSAAELSVLMMTVAWAKCKGHFNVAQTKLKYINLQCENCCG